MTSGFVVLAVLCSFVSVDRDKVTGGGGGGGTGSLTAAGDNMQPVHNKFDLRIRTLRHILNPASSCGRRKLKPQFTTSRAKTVSASGISIMIHSNPHIFLYV